MRVFYDLPPPTPYILDGEHEWRSYSTVRQHIARRDWDAERSFCRTRSPETPCDHNLVGDLVVESLVCERCLARARKEGILTVTRTRKPFQ